MNTRMAELLPSVIEQLNLSAVKGELEVRSPIDGASLGSVGLDKATDVESKVQAAQSATWAAIACWRAGSSAWPRA